MQRAALGSFRGRRGGAIRRVCLGFILPRFFGMRLTKRPSRGRIEPVLLGISGIPCLIPAACQTGYLIRYVCLGKDKRKTLSRGGNKYSVPEIQPEI